MPARPASTVPRHGVGPHPRRPPTPASCRRVRSPWWRCAGRCPAKPSSPMTRLLPPPMISSGVPAASALRTASTTSASVVAGEQPGGGPAEPEGGQRGGLREFLHRAPGYENGPAGRAGPFSYRVSREAPQRRRFQSIGSASVVVCHVTNFASFIWSRSPAAIGPCGAGGREGLERLGRLPDGQRPEGALEGLRLQGRSVGLPGRAAHLAPDRAGVRRKNFRAMHRVRASKREAKTRPPRACAGCSERSRAGSA